MNRLFVWLKYRHLMTGLVLVIALGGLYVVSTSDAILLCSSTITLETNQLAEVSGLVLSPEGQRYLIADSGNPEMIYRFDQSQGILDSVFVQNSKNRDWEAISQTDSTLLIADIGDNPEHRKQVRIFSVRIEDVAEKDTVYAVRYRVRYPDGSQNAEAFFVDPISGAWFIITKGLFHGELYSVTLPLTSREIMTADRPNVLVPGMFISGAEIRSDGLQVVVKSLFHVRIWNRSPDESIAQMFAQRPDATYVVISPLSEAISYGRDVSQFELVSESLLGLGDKAVIHQYAIP
jgi:hypothetical protein